MEFGRHDGSNHTETIPLLTQFRERIGSPPCEQGCRDRLPCGFRVEAYIDRLLWQLLGGDDCEQFSLFFVPADPLLLLYLVILDLSFFLLAKQGSELHAGVSFVIGPLKQHE